MTKLPGRDKLSLRNRRPSTAFTLLSFLFAACSWATAQAPQPSPAPAPSSSSQDAKQDDQKQDQKDDRKQDAEQDSKDQAAKPAAGNPDATQHTPANEQGKVEGTSNDRLFYTLPNFLTLQNGHQLPPMPVKDKFKAVAVGNFDMVEFPWWGVLAAIQQADNGEPAYRQGWLAYAKRYGTTMADSSIENFMVGAVFSSMLHQDPRFYQSDKGGFWRRTGYALSRMVITFSDHGHTQFNYSEVIGSATAGAISTYSYHPRSTYISTPSNPHMFIASDRTLTNALSTWGTQLSLDALTIEIKEFWPDVHRAMQKRHNKNAGPTPAPATTTN
jgi:hypothetical protein